MLKEILESKKLNSALQENARKVLQKALDELKIDPKYAVVGITKEDSSWVWMYLFDAKKLKVYKLTATMDGEEFPFREQDEFIPVTKFL